MNMSNANNVVFIDSQIDNPESLVTGLSPNTAIHYLNSNQDGVGQISDILEQYENLDTVQIFSHGSAGSLQLGNSHLSINNISQYEQELRDWSDSLNEGADLLFFGCNVAQGPDGQAFIQQIDALTGADVAASTDLTGNAALGGDWHLEATTGTIEAKTLLPQAFANYQGTLVNQDKQRTVGQLSGTISGKHYHTDVQSVDHISLAGHVILDVKGDFTLDQNHTISGDNAGVRDSLTIKSGGKVTIAGDIFGGGLKDIKIDAEEIEIKGTALLSTRFISGTNYDTALSVGDSGDITFTTDEGITIDAGAQLFAHVGTGDTEAAGDITLTDVEDTLQTRLLTFPTKTEREGSINVTGSTLKGKDIVITAGGIDKILFSGAPKLVQDLVLDPLISGGVSRIINSVVPASVEVRNSSAEINLTNTTISGSGDVILTSKATADGSVQALRGAYAYNQDDSAGKKAAKISTRIAAAVGYATTNAQTNLKGTRINAGKNVFVTSHTETAARVRARLFGNLQFAGQGADANEYGMSVAVAVTDTESKVLLDSTSAITAGGNVAVDALGNVDSSARAVTKIYVNGNAAAGVGVNHDTADVKALVQGQVTAGGSLSAAPSISKVNEILTDHGLAYGEAPTYKLGEFVGSESVAASEIDGATNIVTFSQDHSFSDGDTITYQNTSQGQDISGLKNGEKYIVRVLDTRRIQLTRGSVLDISSVGLNDDVQHSLSAQRVTAITPATARTAGTVNAANDTIQLSNHGLSTGAEVVYKTTGTAIGGLTSNSIYRAIVVDANTIKLAITAGEATSSTAVDLTSAGTGNQTIETFASLDSRVNASNDTLTLNNHGLVMGQEVIYRADREFGAIDGLKDGEQYYAIVVDANTIKLAADRDNVAAGTAVDLGTGSEGIGHRLESFRQQAKTSTFNPTGNVDVAKDVITLSNHGLYNGQLVTYTDGSSGSAIGGLTDGQEYFAVVLNENQFKLATSRRHMLTGTTLDLTSAGTGTDHQLTFAQNTSQFDPKANVNNALNTVTLKNHGFKTGDAVVYNVDDAYAKDTAVRASRLFDPATAVDVAQDTIAIRASNLKTGDKIVYQSDYLKQAGTVIGGLTNNQEYYVIKVDDGKVKLATTLANAQAGTAIDLTSTGSGLRQLLLTTSEVSVKLDDRALHGLQAGDVYYVTVLDDDTIQLNTSKSEAEAAQPIDLDGTGIAASGHTLSKGTARKQGISINAELTARDRVTTDGSAYSDPKWRDFLSNPDLMVLAAKTRGGILNTSETKNYLKGKDKTTFETTPIQGKNRIAVGLGLAINIIDHDVVAEVGANAVLKSDANVTVDASISQRVQTRTQAQTGKDEAGIAATLALGIGEYDNLARAIVGTGARIDAKRAIDVTSKVEYPVIFQNKTFFDFQGDLSTNFEEKPGDAAQSVIAWTKDLALGGRALLDKLSNTYVTTKNKGKKEKGTVKGGSFGFSGSVAAIDYTNVSEAIIQSGALINQDATYRTGEQSVAVKADTEMTLTGLVGVVHIDVAVDLAIRAKRKGSPAELLNLLGNRAQNGFGGSVFYQGLNNTTTAKIEDGAQIHTSQTGTGLTVKAQENILTVGLAQSGADVEGLGLTGSALALAHTSNTTAQLESGVQVTGGKLTVKAKSDATRVNLSGSLIASNSIGIGLGVAVDKSDRKVKAIIGDEKTGTGAPAADSQTRINVTDIDLDAKVGGYIVSLAVAGNKTISQKVPPAPTDGTGSPSTSSAPTDGDTPAPSLADRFLSKVKSATVQPKAFALGITGGVAGNFETETVQAYIYDSGQINAARNLNLNSANQTMSLAATGVLSITGAKKADDDGGTGSQNIVGLTAGISFNKVTHTTQSFIEGAKFSANQVTLDAQKQLDQGSRTLAVALTPSVSDSSSGQGTVSLNLGGSAAFNLVDSTTDSYIKNGTGQDNIRLTATDGAGYYATAGALGVGLLRKNSDYKGGATAGLSFAMNQIDSRTRSYLDGTTLTDATDKRQVELSATSEFSAIAAAVAGSVAGGTGASDDSSGLGISLAAAGAGAWNNIRSHETAAYVKDSTLNLSGSGSTLTVNAKDNSAVMAIAGSLSLSFLTNKTKPISLSLGASGAVNELQNSSVLAYADNSAIATEQVTLQATSQAQLNAYSIVGAGAGASAKQGNLAGAFAGAGAGTGNYIRRNHIEALVRNKAVITTDLLNLKALDKTKLRSYAVGVSVGVAFNSASQGGQPPTPPPTNNNGNNGGQDNQGFEEIELRELDVRNLPQPDFNRIEVLEAGDVSTGRARALHEEQKPGSGAAVGVGLGVAIARNEVRNTVNANIGNATVTSRSASTKVDVDLQAISQPEIESANVAGAVGAGVAKQGRLGLGIAAGVSVAHTTLSNTVTATIDDSTSVTNGGTISLKALLGKEKASDPNTVQTVSGAAALAAAWSKDLGLNIAVAASVADNVVKDNTVRAAINNGRVTAANDIRLTAHFAPTINATNFGVAAGAGGGAKIGIQAAGAGIGSYNTVAKNVTEALIQNSANVTSSAGQVHLKATDDSVIKAYGGTGSLAAGFGKKVGINAAVGAAVAVNRIGSQLITDAQGNLVAQAGRNRLRASIDGASVIAQKAVTLEAHANSQIDSLNISIAAAVGGGKKAGINLAGAGVGSYNLVGNDIEATIQNGASVISNTADLTLDARDISKIKANGGAVALAAGGGAKLGVSGAVGIAIAENTLNNSLKAKIESASATANNVYLNASTLNISTQRIEALNFGAALAASGGKGAVSLAGAGTGAKNTVRNTLESVIQGDFTLVKARNGNVELYARDQGYVQAKSYVVGVSLAGGGSGAGAGTVAIAKAENTLDSTVRTIVGQASDNRLDISAQDLTLQAVSDTRIDASVESAAVAVAFTINPKSPFAVAVAGSGIIAKNTFKDTVESAVHGGGNLAITNKVDVQAINNSTLNADYGLGSGSAGLLVGTSIAVAQTENTFANTVKGYVDTITWDGNHRPNVSILADNTIRSTTENTFASVGLGIIGLAGAGANAETTINSTVNAYAKDRKDWSIGNLTVKAKNVTDTQVQVNGGAGSAGFAAGAAGASLATVTDNSTVTAYVDFTGHTLNAEAIDIRAENIPKATADALFVAAAVGGASAAGAGTRAKTTINTTTTAYVAAGSTIQSHSLAVQAKQSKPSQGYSSRAIASTGAGAGGALAAVGIDLTYADAYANGTVKAYIGDNANIFVRDDVTVKATNTTNQFAGKEGVSSGGVSVSFVKGVSAGVLVAKTHSNKTTEAYLGDNVALVSRNLTVNANGKNEADVKAITFGASLALLGTSARVGEAQTNSTSTTNVSLGQGSANRRIKVFNTVDIDASYTNEFDKKLAVISASVLGSGVGAYAEHTVDSTVKIDLEDRLQIDAGNIDIDALNTSTKLNPDQTSLEGNSGAGIISVTNLNSEVDATHTTTIDVGDSVRLTQTGTQADQGISLHALNRVNVQEKATARSYGLIGLSGKTATGAEVTTQAAVNIGQNTILDAASDMDVVAHSVNNVRTDTSLETGGLGSGGTAKARTEVTTRDTLSVAANSQLLSFGEITLGAGTGGSFDGTNADLIDIVHARSHERHNALIPKSDAFDSSVETIYNRTRTIDIQTGAQILGAKDVNLLASQLKARLIESGEVRNIYETDRFDDGAAETQTIGVTVNDATVRARRVSEKKLSLSRNSNGQLLVNRTDVVDGQTVNYGDTVVGQEISGVTVFRDAAYNGTSHTFGVGRIANLADAGAGIANFNDTISSLKVGPGYQAILYTGANFQGERTVITTDQTLSGNFHDTVSSLEIVKTPNAAIAYRHSDVAANTIPDADLTPSIDITGTFSLRGDRTDLLVGDFNGDGRDDFIRYETGSWVNGHNDAILYLSLDNGRFESHALDFGAKYGLNSKYTNLFVGDFDGDGRDDILRQEKGPWDDDDRSTAQVFYFRGGGAEPVRWTLAPGQEQLSDLNGAGQLGGDTYNIIVGDFTGDGADDFIAQRKGGSKTGAARLFKSRGASEEGTFWGARSIGDYNADDYNLIAADINGDGKKDLLAQSKASGGEIHTSIANADIGDKADSGFTYEGELNNNSAQDYNIIVGDFDGNGHDDFIRQNKTGTGSSQVFFKSKGDNVTFVSGSLGSVSADTHNIRVGDFNGDGKDDILVQEKGALDDNNINTARVLYYRGGHAFNTETINEQANLKGDLTQLHIGDFDGDGFDEILRQDNQGGTGTLVYPNNKELRSAKAAQDSFVRARVKGLNSSSDRLEIDTASLDFGSINVTGDYFKGSGTLDASANGKIEIVNSSTAALRTHQIDVSHNAGDVTFNFVPLLQTDGGPTNLNTLINEANSDNHQANFSTIKTLQTDGRPLVDIRNTSGSPTLLQLSGQINNWQGIVRTRNASGDTLASGDINAHTLDISTGGSFFQGYTRGTRQVGGNVESQWFETARASAQANSKVDRGSTGGTSTILADDVFIAAQRINVNGTIQAGRANHGAVISNNTEFQTAINQFNAQYARDTSQHLFDFNTEGHGITPTGSNHKLVRLRWNARDRRIEAHNIDVKGGYLELHGRIFSTGNGQLNVLDGFSQIQIENKTNHDLHIDNLTNTAVEGTIKITDTSRSGNSPQGFHVTAIERNGNTIKTTVNGTSSTTTGRTSRYATKADQIYSFRTSQQFIATHARTTDISGFIISKADSNVFNDLRPQGNVLLREASGRLETRAQTSAYDFKANDGRYIHTSGVQASGNTRTVTTIYDQYHKHYIDADRDIAISFIGDDQGSVRVKSLNSDVTVQGALTNYSGLVSIEAKQIQGNGSSQGRILSNQVSLTAQNGIDNLTVEGTEDLNLAATTATGDLNLKAAGSVVSNARLEAGRGNLTFDSLLDINNGHFQGDRVTLTSTAGTIRGTVNTGETSTSALTATAQDDIILKETNGHLRLDKVESKQGDVTLIVEQGDVVDANTSQREHDSVLQELEKFADTTAVDAYVNDVNAARKVDFETYWTLRDKQNPADISTYSFSYTATQRQQLKDQGKTDAEITQLEQDQTAWVKARHQEFGSPATYDANGFKLSTQQVANLKTTLTNTVSTLKKQVAALGKGQTFEYFFSLLNKRAGLADEKANIIGQNITLEAQKGNVGQTSTTPLIVNRTTLTDALTTAQQQALTQAETQGLVTRQGNNVIITPKDDIDVTASGVVDALAVGQGDSGDVYLGSTGALSVGTIRAGGEVQIRSAGDVTDGNGTDTNITHGEGLLILPKDSADALPTGFATKANTYAQTTVTLTTHNGLTATSGVYDFDGTNDYGSLANQPTGGAFTFSAWVNYDSFNQWSRIFDFGDGAGNNNILLANEGTSDDLVFEVYDGNRSVGKVKINDFWQEDTWIHVTASIDASGKMKVYKNGVLAGEATLSGNAPPTRKTRTQNFIGKSAWSGDAAFDGQMTEIGLRDGALSDSDVFKAFLESERPPTDSVITTTHNGLTATSGVYDFDGTDDYGTLASQPTGGAFTFSGWVNYDSFNQWSRIFDFGDGAGNNNILLANEGTTKDLVFEVYNGSKSAGKIKIENFWQEDTWIHVTASIDASGKMKVYKNGVLAGEATLSGNAPPARKTRTQNYIGKSAWSGDAAFDGQLAGIELRDRALSDGDVFKEFLESQRPQS